MSHCGGMRAGGEIKKWERKRSRRGENEESPGGNEGSPERKKEPLGGNKELLE